MIRIRQPGINFWGGHQLSLAPFEIYGSAKYDPTRITFTETVEC
jgi:hypothetical protein